MPSRTIEIIKTKLSVITIANATAKDVLLEDKKVSKDSDIFISNKAHSLLALKIYVDNLKELTFETCRNYVKFIKENDGSNFDGFEFYYIKEIEFMRDDTIVFKVFKETPLSYS